MPSEKDHQKIEQRADIWSRYWSSGARHSCLGSFGQHYEGAIGRWWQTVFEGLQPGQRVLDVATGSGALLQLALKHIPSQTVHLHGVDVGQVAPAWARELAPEQRARVQIHSGVSAESLPFADQSFGLITSQFGLEYTGLDRSLTEIRRVLVSGGALRCILHHANSQSVMLARTEVTHTQWLLAPGGLLDVTEQLCGPFSQAATPQGRVELAGNQKANVLRQAFNALQDERLQLISTSDCPDVLHEASDAVNNALQSASRQGVVAASALVQQFAQKLRDSEFRLADLIDHALSEQSLDDLLHQLKALGFTATSGELMDATLTMGWWLKADSPS